MTNFQESSKHIGSKKFNKYFVSRPYSIPLLLDLTNYSGKNNLEDGGIIWNASSCFLKIMLSLP